MKQLLFLLFLPCLALAQYPGNAGQKITLGEQTTADGLVYRGVASIDTVTATSKITRANKQDTSTYLLLDTTTNLLWHYKIGSNGWIQAGGSTFDTTTLNLVSRFALKLNISDTLSMLSPYFRDADTSLLNLTSRFLAKQNTLTLTTTGTSGAATLVNSTLNIPQYSGGGGVDSTAIAYVNTYGTQTVNGAKTFTSALTATRFNPTANTATGTGMYLPATNTLGFSTNGTNKLTLNASGNLGLGVTPSAWGSSYTSMQIGTATSLFNINAGSGYTYLSNNAYINSSTQSIYINNGYATNYAQIVGEHRWSTASSGTAGNAITFTQAMTLDASGNLGIGTISPTAVLHLKAGTSSANTAPLKFTSGTNLTTAEAGAMEFNGTNLFFSPSTTRHTVNHGLTGSATIDFADTSANSYSDQTITVTGASDGDVVSLGIPNSAMSANNITYTAWVSASNTVTIRFANHTTASVNPASGTFKVFVTK